MYVVMTVYQVNDGAYPSFLTLVDLHREVLAKEGLTTKGSELLRVDERMFIELIYWMSADAAEKAHSRAAVEDIWGQLGALVEFKSLADVPSIDKPFQGFESAASKSTRSIRHADIMIAAENHQSLCEFYEKLLNTSKNAGPGFLTLNDEDTGQALCITDGQSVVKMGIGCEVDDLPGACEKVISLGGKVTNKWEYEQMKDANAVDLEGNELLLYTSG